MNLLRITQVLIYASLTVPMLYSQEVVNNSYIEGAKMGEQNEKSGLTGVIEKIDALYRENDRLKEDCVELEQKSQLREALFHGMASANLGLNPERTSIGYNFESSDRSYTITVRSTNDYYDERNEEIPASDIENKDLVKAKDFFDKQSSSLGIDKPEMSWLSPISMRSDIGFELKNLSPEQFSQLSAGIGMPSEWIEKTQALEEEKSEVYGKSREVSTEADDLKEKIENLMINGVSDENPGHPKEKTEDVSKSPVTLAQSSEIEGFSRTT